MSASLEAAAAPGDGPPVAAPPGTTPPGTTPKEAAPEGTQPAPEEAPAAGASAQGPEAPQDRKPRRTGRRRLPRLVGTTAFRFTLVYLFVFATAVAALGFLLYRSTFGVVERQTDALIDRDIEVLADVFAEDGAGVLRRVIGDRSAWRDDGLYMLIAAPSGARLAGNLSALPAEAVAARAAFFDFSYDRPALDAAGRETGVESRRGRGKLRRFRASPEATQSFLVFVARDITAREALRERTTREMARIAAATVALGVGIGLAFSRSLLRRVDAVNRTARAIRDGDLSQRVRLRGSGDELDDLSANLNAMLDRIERLMTGMREVSDNIAHDLRSPLSRIRSRLQDAMRRPPAEKDAALEAALADAERMIGLFNALLSIARIESGEGAGALDRLDLAAVAGEAVELYEPAAEEAGFALSAVYRAAPPVLGSRALIGQAIANLFDNALKYARGGTRLTLAVGPGPNGGARLSVADDGPGVPAADRGKVLQRFVRLEPSRSAPGSGLGLALVAAIARAHDAELTLADAAGGGLEARLDFPAADRRK